ncbi:hypothetical protein CJ030_MR7G016712 [Morella rubra]|uniref:GDSL esterase/lipase n=1 Tax=Morella rubra TaxID=262757 RepID=A0A6A1UZ29_9ROSI|nr:hypothetical protein CJ030_MR7G016712 [Morella rubra]
MRTRSGSSDEDNFYLSGPTHDLINAIDWPNPHHRRPVASSLFQGVYVLEGDRQQKRQGPQALAPPWWNVFNFKLKEVLKDNGDMSLFGAVYEFQNPIHPAIEIPKYFIAFRGTLIEPDTRSQDFKLDLQCFCNTIHQSSRFQVAIRTVQKFVDAAGAPNIWLTRHSLGSAIALLAGKNTSKMGCFLETYLFNPPFISYLIVSLYQG